MAFFVLEGGEGAGKTTQFNLLKDRADTVFRGRDVVFTREPGGSAYGEEIRALLLGESGKDASARTQLSLFFAARFDHVENIVLPHLARGGVVVSDRFAASTYAYQVAARAPELKALFHAFMEELTDALPTRTILIDVPADVAYARMLARNGEQNHMDTVPFEVHERRRAGYFEYLEDIAPNASVVVDGNRSPEEVHADIVRAIQELL